MAKDYKKAIKDKRLEAGNLMTEKQIAQCNAAIHTASVAAGANGFIPIPVADAVPISAAQVTMVIALGKIFDQQISSSVAKGAIGAAASTFVGRNLVKMIPIVGWGVSAAVAAGVTEAIGWTIAVDMAKSYRQDYKRKIAAEDAAAAWAEAEAIQRCINNKKVTGHHAIIPTAKITDADLSQLPEAQRNVLCLIAARLVLATAEPHRYEAVKATVRCAGTNFTATGKTVREIGWKALEANVNALIRTKATDEETDDGETKALPEMTQGQTFSGVTAAKQEHWTAPPRPFTEATLLSAMERAGNDEYDEETEKKGMGTPSTRAGIIEELVKNEYIQRKGRQITATERGVKLISVVPDEVKSPKLTAEWEMQLQQIERGKASATAFMDSITAYVRNKCAKYSTADGSVSFRRQSEAVGKCPYFGGEVKKGQYGYYCTQKCGMYLAKVYGKVLTDTQLMRLLSGKETSFTVDGKKTIVLPEAVEHTYNGKTSWQWRTKKG